MKMANDLSNYATKGEATVARRLVKALLAREMFVSVNDGEEWTVKKSRAYGEIVNALCSTGEDYLRAYAPTGDCLGGFYLVWGNADDGSELISDHTANDFCDRLSRIAYNEAQDA
jgi:hypothetical protein